MARNRGKSGQSAKAGKKFFSGLAKDRKNRGRSRHSHENAATPERLQKKTGLPYYPGNPAISWRDPWFTAPLLATTINI
jgi:hypothetical protein